MLGKNCPFTHKSSYFLILTAAIVLCGCQNLSPSDNTSFSKPQANELTFEEPGNRFIGQFQEVNIDALFQSELKYTYPDDVYFTPTALSNDGVLYGEARSTSNSDEVYLAEYNLTTNEFQKVKDVDEPGIYTTIAIDCVSDSVLVFEEYNPANLHSIIYCMDLTSHKINQLFSEYDIEPSQITPACEEENHIFAARFDTKKNHYQMYEFNSEINSTIIENQNCFSPVIFDGNLYYLLIDNENLVIKIVQYDIDAKTKTVLYQTTGNEKYISGLYANDNTLLVSLNDQVHNEWYSIDLESHKANYCFTTDYVESVKYKTDYFAWTGPVTQKNRARLENYLINTEKEIKYLNPNGPILLSDNGMACIMYKKDDADIDKGKVYTNENTYIAYMHF